MKVIRADENRNTGNKMYRTTVKKIFFVVGMLLMIGTGMWVIGRAEGTYTINHEAVIEEQFKAAIKYTNLGNFLSIEWEIDPPDANPNIDQTWAYSYRNWSSTMGELTLFDETGASILLSADLPEEVEAFEYMKTNFDPGMNGAGLVPHFSPALEVRRGDQVQITDVIGNGAAAIHASQLQKTLDKHFKHETGRRFLIPLGNSDDPVNHTFMIVQRQGTAIRAWKFRITGYVHEFFAGERLLFAKQSLQAYTKTQKQLALASLLLSDLSSTALTQDEGNTFVLRFQQVNPGISADDLTNLRSSFRSLPEFQENLKKLQNNLFRLLGVSLDPQALFFDEVILHNLLYDPKSQANSDVYLRSLMNFYFNKDMDTVKEIGTAAFRALVLDQTQAAAVSSGELPMISVEEGQQLAKQALGYLRGAVNYFVSPFAAAPGGTPSKDFQWVRDNNAPLDFNEVASWDAQRPGLGDVWEVQWGSGKKLRRFGLFTGFSDQIKETNIRSLDNPETGSLLWDREAPLNGLNGNREITIDFLNPSRPICVQIQKGVGLGEISFVGVTTSLNASDREFKLPVDLWGERGYNTQTKQWSEFQRQDAYTLRGASLKADFADGFFYLQNTKDLKALKIRFTAENGSLDGLRVFDEEPLAYLSHLERKAPVLGSDPRTIDGTNPILIVRTAEGAAGTVSLTDVFSDAASDLGDTWIYPVLFTMATDAAVIKSPIRMLDLRTFDSATGQISRESVITYRKAGIPGPSAKLLDQINAMNWSAPIIQGDKGVVVGQLPVLYAKGGLETPETFNQKVWNTFLYWNNRYLNGLSLRRLDLTALPQATDMSLLQSFNLDSHFEYIVPASDSRITDATAYFIGFGYPFLLGKVLPWETAILRNSPYQISKTAGTDSWGLLTGAAVLAQVENLCGYQGESSFISLRAASYFNNLQTTLSNKTSTNDFRYFSPGFPKVGPDFTKDGYVWTRMDLEASSVIVPRVQDVRKGDLVVGSENGESRVGIVVGFTGENGQALSAQTIEEIVLVTTDASFGAAHLALWGNGKGPGGFSENPRNYIVRRFLKNPNNLVETARVTDFFDIQKLRYDVDFSAFKSNDWARWIPNTEEFHHLGMILIRQSDELPVIKDNTYTSFLPPLDRGPTTNAPANGNIDRNSDTEFWIVALRDSANENGVSVQIVTDGNNQKTVAGFPIDEAAVVGRFAISEDFRIAGYSYPYIAEAGHPEGRLRVDKAGGQLVYELANRSYKYFAIVAKAKIGSLIRPGDDIVLRFAKPRVYADVLERPAAMIDDHVLNVVTAASLSSSISNPARYLAVYDKKMLWRANLYIEENGENGKDWNDVHPWVTGNEWNRYHDGLRAFKGLKDLPEVTQENVGLGPIPAGIQPGGQVIKFPEFTPVRTLGNLNNPPVTNSIAGTVAYSYPDHEYEPPSYSKGDAGSMDSPFDYNKKMLMQIALLKDWYNGSGVPFAKPRSKWPVAAETTTASTFGTWALFKENVTGSTNQKKIIPQNLFNSLEGNSVNWAANLALNNALTHWTDLTPPQNRWWKYIVITPDGWSDAADPVPITKIFVPSLGLRRDVVDNAAYDEASNGVPTDSFLKRKYVIEAGTDCIGFAQRASSYDGSQYKWLRLPKGWTEMNKDATGYTGSDDIWAQMNTYGQSVGGVNQNRVYPIPERSLTYGEDIVVRNVKVPNDDGTLLVNLVGGQPTITQLRKIVPGDIWVKDSTSDKPSDFTPPTDQDPFSPWRNNHIAIVASVPADPESITDPLVYMNEIILIEGEFTNKIQSVIKKLSVGDYNQSKVVGPITFYPAFALGKDVELGLNCQSWAIRRLK